ncbi:MAG: patatin-like phospholipase family protein [Actinomycetota bacterium]|nr:patatin-like phospholipase family protein [Actinomycetota bacterium]
MEPVGESASTALVLAGGGLAGIAWELGVLDGLVAAAPELASVILGADMIVGTSAGATVAVQLTSGLPLAKLADAQLVPPTAELATSDNLYEIFTGLAELARGARDVEAAGRRIGAMALAARTVEPDQRLRAIAARLPTAAWPACDLRLTAVDAESGELRVFTAAAGVSLRDAVAASSAVPGIWPPVEIGGRRYIDGAVRSMTNADLAQGAGRVLILQPLPEETAPWGSLEREIAALGSAEVVVISADEASVAAIGDNPLDAASRPAAVRAGRRLGAGRASALARRWSTRHT